jgi:hypothetical protein
VIPEGASESAQVGVQIPSKLAILLEVASELLALASQTASQLVQLPVII